MHQGRLLSDLVIDDPTYCRWVLRIAEEVMWQRIKNIGLVTGLGGHFAQQRFVTDRGVLQQTPLRQAL